MKKLLWILSATLLLGAEDFTNDIGMKFVKIPSGSFMMGRDAAIENGGSDEVPQHRVSVETFAMQTTEVTQGQWMRIMGSNPSKFTGSSHPVEQVSWNDAQKFIQKLNKLEGTSAYRLPTEAEWEYAARAGSQSIYYFGDKEESLDSHAWYGGKDGTHIVAQKLSNRWGLYDMHGNVWEWCQDWYRDTYHDTPRDDRANTGGEQKYRVLRGGGWNSNPYYVRIATRFNVAPTHRTNYYGFRLARTLP